MIIITGISRGIGLFLYDEFKNNNEEVIGAYNSTEPSEDALPFAKKVDISDFTQVSEWID